MGNKLCAPWKKPYTEDDHWTPRKDSHLLRLWAEIFEVQEANGEICWSRVSDDVVPVNITCIQNHPNTVFHITAYNRHVEKIFDVRLVQPGTRITQASECFAHWKDSKCDHEWGLNFTTPLDARRFHDCCMKVQCRKAASNPTSPVAHSRVPSSALDEFLVDDAIEAGFLLPGRDKQHNEIDNSLDSERLRTYQLACENVYTRLSHNLEVQSQNNSLAEREIPYVAKRSWALSTCGSEFGDRTSQHKCKGENCVNDSYNDRVLHQELRQFSREPSTLNICNMKNHDCSSTDDYYSNANDTIRVAQSELKTAVDDKECTHEQRDKCAETLCIQSGFDSTTLKRLLQTFPNSAPLAQEFLRPISQSVNAKWHGSYEQESPIIPGSHLIKNSPILGQNNISTTLLLQQQSNNFDMTSNGPDINVTPFNDQKQENIQAVEILPFRLQQPFISRSTAIRKTGYLLIQNWLSCKIVSVVLSPHRFWKQFWICLKGTALLLYDYECNNTRHEHPTHVLGCLAHPHSDSVGCENTFSVSTIFGSAYLFKTSSKAEMNNWIYNIHLACAASFARHLGKSSAMKLLSNEIHKLENSIDLDLKMKKMAGMQMHTVNDPIDRDILNRQIASWDENLEKLFIEQYQLRCYLSALQGGELPCAKVLLSSISDATKANFNVITPVAFHAFVCARMPVTATNGVSHFLGKHETSLLSTFKADNSNKLQHNAPRPMNQKSRNSSENVNMILEDSSSLGYQVEHTGNVVSINLPKNQTLVFRMNDKTTVEDLLLCACTRCHLNSSNHFVRIKRNDNKLYRIPDKNDLIILEDGERLEVCAKVFFQAEIFRSKKERDFGFSLEAKSSEFSNQDMSVYISEIGKGMIAGSKKGLQVGDELIVLNNLMVSELDMVFIESTLEECDRVTLTVRSCRIVDQSCEIQREHAGEMGYIPTLSTQLWQRDELHGIDRGYRLSNVQNEHDESVSLHLLQEDLNIADESSHIMHSLNDSQRCHSVIMELIETERQYVKDLNWLIESYLEPLEGGTFLSDAVVERLFGNVKEIVQFQKIFLQSMEEAINEEELNSECIKTKKCLFSLGSAFLYYAHHFKLYSSFCASHSKAQKILLSENLSFQEFLRLHNLSQQSASLESYLIKPIKRIGKYTQLLRTLIFLTSPRSEECAHLKEALHGMEAVAEHINEMQKIYEEYGSILDEMMNDYRDVHPKARDLDLNVGELQMYGTVNWLNALSELGTLNKGMELLTLLFIFKSGVVLMAQECLKGKRKSQHGRPSLCGENIETARFKIVIPVEQLHVRTMVGDAHECHGVWEMVQCGSEIVCQQEKIFQFASSQEARRDFIRTIQQTILHNRKELFESLPCHRSSTVPENCEHTPTLQKRPESLLMDSMTDSLLKIPDIEGSVFCKNGCVCRVDNIQEKTEGSECKNNHELSENDVLLGSQSTLASDRAGARLVQASHNRTTYSNHIETREPNGSPIWKPRQGSKNLEILKARNLSEDVEEFEHLSIEPKPKVAFIIPRNEFHIKGTDC